MDVKSNTEETNHRCTNPQIFEKRGMSLPRDPLREPRGKRPAEIETPDRTRVCPNVSSSKKSIRKRGDYLGRRPPKHWVGGGKMTGKKGKTVPRSATGPRIGSETDQNMQSKNLNGVMVTKRRKEEHLEGKGGATGPTGTAGTRKGKGTSIASL